MRYYVFVLPHAGGWRVSLTQDAIPAPEATLDFPDLGGARAHALDLGAKLAKRAGAVKVIQTDYGNPPSTIWTNAEPVEN